MVKLFSAFRQSAAPEREAAVWLRPIRKDKLPRIQLYPKGIKRFNQELVLDALAAGGGLPSNNIKRASFSFIPADRQTKGQKVRKNAKAAEQFNFRRFAYGLIFPFISKAFGQNKTVF